MNTRLRVCGLALLALCLSLGRAAGLRQAAAVIDNGSFRWTLNARGVSVGFVDTATGRDYCVLASAQPVATVRVANKVYPSTVCALADGRLTLEFGGADCTAAFDLTDKDGYVLAQLASASGPGLQEVVLSLPALSLGTHVSGMAGSASDGRFACALRTIDPEVEFRFTDGDAPVLSAAFSAARKLAGARVAIVAVPAAKLRATLQAVVRAEGLPYSALGGPFAADAPANRTSYVFAEGLSESNVDQWIALAKQAGIGELHFNGWQRSSGHYEPAPNWFPHGMVGLQQVVSQIHAAGLRVGLHTFTDLISTYDPYVTPVPDRRLYADASFVLSAAMNVADAQAAVAQPPRGLETFTAINSRGNVLQIDDELIQYGDYTTKAPYVFTQCKRGAFGTKPQAHAAGAAVRHLRMAAGYFAADPATALPSEIADRIANVVNTCQFDSIYTDGAEGTPGGWYEVGKMRAAIYSRLQRPALVEGSTWDYPSWPFHSRIGAWDYPRWGLKGFVDLHCHFSDDARTASLLPAQLGWWRILGAGDDRYAQFPDEAEYLFCKALAFDMPMSFQGVGLGKAANGRQNEILQMLARYERLRLARTVPEAIRAKLRAPDQDFSLEPIKGGGWGFVPTDYVAHKVTGTEDGSPKWTVANRYADQPLTLRIQALHSAAPYDSPDGITVADWRGPLPTVEASAGAAGAVSLEAAPDSSPVVLAERAGTPTGPASGTGAPAVPSTPTTQPVVPGSPSTTPAPPAGTVPGGPPAGGPVPGGQVLAYQALAPATGRAWTRASFTFPPRDLSKCGALGVWVYGDGKGETLNLQLSNPVQYGQVFDDHYITIDFTGWRYVELHIRERDAATFDDYGWPYGEKYSSIYVNPLNRSVVNALNLYISVPTGVQAKVLLRPVRALPVAAVRLANPVLTLNGQDLAFPVTLASGQYIELSSATDARIYNENGEMMGRVTPQGSVPTLQEGDSAAAFRCDVPAGYRPRASVTVVAKGDPLVIDGGGGRNRGATFRLR